MADAGAASLRVSGLEVGGLFGSLLAGKLSGGVPRWSCCLLLLSAFPPSALSGAAAAVAASADLCCGRLRGWTLAGPAMHQCWRHLPSCFDCCVLFGVAGAPSDILINRAKGKGGNVGKRIQVRHADG